MPGSQPSNYYKWYHLILTIMHEIRIIISLLKVEKLRQHIILDHTASSWHQALISDLSDSRFCER